MKHLIVVNGPPRSGKDTLVSMIENLIWHNDLKEETSTVNFKEPLIEIFEILADLPEGFNYEEAKVERYSHLGGMSGRELMIKISEDWVKPDLGRDFFGLLWAKRMQDEIYETDDRSDFIGLCADCGFFEEAMQILDVFQPEEVTWVSLEREGCSFEGDSRSYLTQEQLDVLGFKYIHHYKNTTFEDLHDFAKRLLKEIH